MLTMRFVIVYDRITLSQHSSYTLALTCCWISLNKVRRMKLSSSVSLLHLFAIMKQMWVVETLSVAVSSRSSAFGRSLRMRTTTTTTTRHQSGYSRSRITMMPEGPEVKTLVDQLQGGVGMQYKGIEFLSGRYVRHGRPATYDEFANTLSASANNNDDTVDSIVEWNAKGKFIYIVLNDGKHIRTEDDDFKRSIWVTLGMSGRFVAQAQQEHQRTEARWALQLSNDGSKVSQIFYHDPRNYGTLKFCLSAKELEAKLKTLGPDILQSDDTTEGIFVDLVAKQKPELNVCKFLMNQKVRCPSCLCATGCFRLWTCTRVCAYLPYAQYRRQINQCIVYDCLNSRNLNQLG